MIVILIKKNFILHFFMVLNFVLFENNFLYIKYKKTKKWEEV